jgi:hypothetical protein
MVTELYTDNVCDSIAFQSETELVNAHLLNYNKAWVEFALPKNKWHLVSSPLQGTISGEWYAPTWSGRQETTYYEPITFDVTKPINSMTSFSELYQNGQNCKKSQRKREEMKITGTLYSETDAQTTRVYWSEEYNL